MDTKLSLVLPLFRIFMFLVSNFPISLFQKILCFIEFNEFYVNIFLLFSFNTKPKETLYTRPVAKRL